MRDVGIHSVGQRIAILKAVYGLKVQQNIPIEEGHYIPPCECLLTCAAGSDKRESRETDYFRNDPIL